MDCKAILPWLFAMGGCVPAVAVSAESIEPLPYAAARR